MILGETVGGKLPQRPPFPARKIWRLCFLIPCIVLLSACGRVDYSTERNQFFTDSADSDSSDSTRGQVYVNFSDSDIAKPYVVDFKRIRSNNNKGYGFQAPIYDDRDSFKTSLALTRTKEYKWFSGLQMRWEF